MKSPVWLFVMSWIPVAMVLNLWNADSAWGQVTTAGYYQTPAAQYFGGNRGYQPNAPTRNHAPAPQQSVEHPRSKPFQNIQQASAISPYLSLDVVETTSGMPNYYAFVQPQLQQRAAVEQQNQQIRRLQQQVRIAQAQGIASQPSSNGMPTTGHSSQFMNLGTYFPGSVR